ncbi:HCO3 transporter family protein [Morchella snyderi]|nr:HCO3 transporter family protein [Morchella snyderi]
MASSQARLNEQPPQHTAHTNRLSTTMSRGSIGDGGASTKKTMWLGRGMVNDIRRRAPYYWSDWTDAWDYRIIPSTIYMFFANVLPALAFSFDMFEKTDMSYGVNEVLLASVLGAVVFSFLAAQPLCIVGVTGPITVFNYTVYDIVTPRGIPYFKFMCWICLWSMIMHIILAITNACNAVKWVTRFSCDIFGFYVAFIYLQKGIQILTLQWHASDAAAHLSISISLLVLMVGYGCGVIGDSNLFKQPVRTFLKDYGTPLTVIFFTGYQFVGKMADVKLEQLPISKAFHPTIDRPWLVDFWNIEVGHVFLAVPFAILLTILFYFDHNVSSLICQGSEFPLKKPAGFHWDIFILGITTGVSGILGLPAPNGLIPQAPFHTASLCVTRKRVDDVEQHKGKTETVIDHVVEQRVSNLLQGLMILGIMTGPLLIVLALIPQAVLAGLFFVMGIQALEENGMTLKIAYLLKDRALTHGGDPLNRCRKGAVWAFVAIELVGFGATFAITQTIAAIGFPVFIFLLIPMRTNLLPKYFTAEELGILDAPTASPFTLESAGGSYGDYPESVDISPQDSETIDTGALSDSDESVMERGDSMRLERRRPSAVRPGNEVEIEEGPQHRRARR